MPFQVGCIGGYPAGDTCMRFTIFSNRVLRGMVRMIVGSLVLAGAGRLEKDLFEGSRSGIVFGKPRGREAQRKIR